MKESQIVAERVAALEAELAQAKQTLIKVESLEAASGTVEERREYAHKLYDKILLDYDSLDVESDAADIFISQVIDDEQISSIAESYGRLITGSHPFIKGVDEVTLDKIIAVLEACITYIEDEGVLDIWLEFDAVNCILVREDENEDEDEDDDEEF